jgi:hypothetical protein
MPSARSNPSKEREPLAGLVERVTFHNADNGFCVLRVKVGRRRGLITVLGARRSPPGNIIQASGSGTILKGSKSQSFARRAPAVKTSPLAAWRSHT